MVKVEAETLADSVQKTSNLSESVSKKVRQLDTAQSRVNNTLESIEYIVNRTNAVDGVQQALHSGDYEAAAEYVDTLLQSEDKYGKAHQDRSIKQSEQQSRVWFHYLASLQCPGDKYDLLARNTKTYCCRRLQRHRKRSETLFRNGCRMRYISKNTAQLSVL